MHTALLLLPDFALILLGTAIRRWMHLGDHFWTGVEKLVYFILFPALLINAIVKPRLDLGAALPLLLLFSQVRQSIATTAMSEQVAVEIVRTLVGSIGLVASVPIATALAAAVLKAKPPAT